MVDILSSYSMSQDCWQRLAARKGKDYGRQPPQYMSVQTYERGKVCGEYCIYFQMRTGVHITPMSLTLTEFP